MPRSKQTSARAAEKGRAAVSNDERRAQKAARKAKALALARARAGASSSSSSAAAAAAAPVDAPASDGAAIKRKRRNRFAWRAEMRALQNTPVVRLTARSAFNALMYEALENQRSGASKVTRIQSKAKAALKEATEDLFSDIFRSAISRTSSSVLRLMASDASFAAKQNSYAAKTPADHVDDVWSANAADVKRALDRAGPSTPTIVQWWSAAREHLSPQLRAQLPTQPPSAVRDTIVAEQRRRARAQAERDARANERAERKALKEAKQAAKQAAAAAAAEDDADMQDAQ